MGLMTSIAIGSAVAGMAINARGQIKAGNAARAVGESEAARLEFNARIAEEQALDAEARGQIEAGRFRSGVRQLIGSQRTGFAGQGVQVGSGSALDVQADASTLGELDARQIVSNAERQAWGFRNEAEDLRLGADVARRGGKAQQTASRWGAAGTVLGGASSLLLSRYGWDRNVQITRPA